MSEPAAAAPSSDDPAVADGGAEDEKEVIGADGKKISKSQLKKQAKAEEQAKKKAERLKKVEEEKVKQLSHAPSRAINRLCSVTNELCLSAAVRCTARQHVRQDGRGQVQRAERGSFTTTRKESQHSHSAAAPHITRLTLS